MRSNARAHPNDSGDRTTSAGQRSFVERIAIWDILKSVKHNLLDKVLHLNIKIPYRTLKIKKTNLNACFSHFQLEYLYYPLSRTVF